MCTWGRRINLFTQEEILRAFQHTNCGRGCDRHAQPHRGVRVTAETPAPRGKLSSSFKAMVEQAGWAECAAPTAVPELAGRRLLNFGANLLFCPVGCIRKGTSQKGR